MAYGLGGPYQPPSQRIPRNGKILDRVGSRERHHLVRRGRRLSKPGFHQSHHYQCCRLRLQLHWSGRQRCRFWWPFPNLLPYYWPDGVPREATVTAFVRAFELLGYSLCADGDLVAGVEKVVLYTGQQGTPKHMARQLEWDSGPATEAGSTSSTPALRRSRAVATATLPTL